VSCAARKRCHNASSAGFGAGYDWHESRGWAANTQWTNFSDGNRRRAAGFRFVQRVADKPHLKVTLRPEVYLSTNSSDRAPYFNPSRDFSGALSAEVNHILWRRYERSFRQRLSGGGGTYWQRGYSSGVLATATYEQSYNFGPAMALNSGATFARRVYDGQPCPSLTLSIGLVGSF